ncbi:bifunctional UDP-N-acetylmuramoyl-tripeptide:D-alanyl-D-alanine ligase/alanine racemase [Algoriphagus sp. CAU 1675]|uniref:bifunctional UDP-N-acetylmuramoyl-tripeptide:D-alanyl-D-alanine ligase/alanine racemase n=1 Tax=Algoriphagus sp. CAU 1675 TaxID=3032597 RepID=UPI0023DB8549|nr:bifunctional UDP-N-acetylmuramoyl-tripeptide:D-alanyl-D-alanine ligase/alanine racemase [Algoriphagus sp. CAU 1675]MDF2156467.1 bifunctional UDP-N-acetylmuramoyl-tripeptide:D-alanyl-D-alanine ligase/alanine racemase [Algoriphagus sp. CAU 1675]
MIQDLSLKKITEIIEGKLLRNQEELVVSQFSIDSRQILNPVTTLFFALKGAKANGESFIPALVQLGVRAFVVSESYDTPEKPVSGLSFIQVKDPRRALQKLARYQREQFKNPVLGITGSNGKTIVKEWLGQVLSQKYSIAKSPKSYNSQVGVPLSIFGIEPYHQLAILEAGISTAGEMEILEEMIRPDIGIFTNIGTAHQEGFSSQEAKIREKLKLFTNSRFLIYSKDHELLREEIEARFDADKLISWSDHAGADFARSVKIRQGGANIILMKTDLSTLTFQVPFSDQASLENITHVIVAALTLGMDASSIQEGLSHLKGVEMRLTLKPGVNDSLLIDDTYNNDLAGLKVALDFMQQQRPKRRKILILSDLLQQGQPEIIYPEVAKLIQAHHINQVIAVGNEIRTLSGFLKEDFLSYPDTEALLREIEPGQFENDLILITGARPFGFERIVNKLQQRIHGTTLEINLNALTHNFNFYKKLLNPQTKVMVMVKAFAYGGGAVEIANHLQTMGADYLAVAYSDEGVALRKHGIRLPIMVLNPVEESFELCSEYELEPVVFSPEFFKSLAAWCSHQGKSMSVHLDLDTGMRRLGFETAQLEELKKLIQMHPELKIASLYTHLVGADEEIHRDFSLEQLELFTKMKDELLGILPNRPLIHALNSAGIVGFPEYQFDMVRLGIGLYGVEVSGRYDSQLRAISTLKTTVSQVKDIAPGQSIGYSRKGKLDSKGQIATLSIGYADGYDRRFSNGKGYVLIHGKKASVVGNVCMDMVMVDVSGMDVKAGDEAIIYGEQISLKELAEQIGTIPYELLTNISTRVKRVYYLD